MAQKYPMPMDWRSRVIGGGVTLAVGRCEDTPNRGQVPDYCVHTNGYELGEFWCFDYAATPFHKTLRLASPFLKSGSCEQQRQRAIAKGALHTRAEFEAARKTNPLEVAGWVGLCIGPDQAGKKHAHHAFLVGVVAEDGTIAVNGPHGGFLIAEGNAADPTKPSSRNGDGAYAGRERGVPNDATEYEFIDPLAMSLA